MAGISRKKLGWIELGRGIAATAVALSHSSLAGTPDDVQRTLIPLGPWGVAFFFVLSGFIIFHIHEDDLDQPSLAINFMWRRFLRILPTYWLVLFLDAGLRGLGSADIRPDFSLAFWLREIPIAPGSSPFISVAWTLRHEMVFYSLFVIAILNLRAGMIVFSIWFIAIVFCIFQVGPIEPRPQTFLQILSSRLDLYFFLGVLVAFALRRGFIRPIAVASAAAAIPLYWVGGAIADTFFQMMVCTALVCLCIQLSSVAASPKVFLWMGAISYPLYLINETAFHLIGGLFHRVASVDLQSSWQLKMLSALALSFAVASVIASGFDKALTMLRLPGIFKPRVLHHSADATH